MKRIPTLPVWYASPSLPLLTYQPASLRGIDQPVLVTALAGAIADEDRASVEFLLSNISTRMAENLREEMGERGKVRQKDADDAMAQIVGVIRALVDEGAITLIEEEGDEQ